MQPSQELLRGARGELLIFYQKEIACNTAGCRVSKKWLNATFSSFFHPVLAPMAKPHSAPRRRDRWFMRYEAGCTIYAARHLRQWGNIIYHPPFPGALAYFAAYSLCTYSARMALSTARTITPTSANIAAHMLAIPSAPSIRQSAFTPRANAMFW